jgi:hypothetical protein
MPIAREKGLMLVRQLTMRICVTSHSSPTFVLSSNLSSVCSISQLDERGQKEGITSYIKSVVHTDPKMQAWTPGDKELVINVVKRRVGGTEP